jgi:hypothetical protein
VHTTNFSLTSALGGINILFAPNHYSRAMGSKVKALNVRLTVSPDKQKGLAEKLGSQTLEPFRSRCC